MKKIIVIVGPTATGKTDLALNLADKLNSYIISGDSMQIYQGFPIGTAQPDLNKIKRPYFLVDILDPQETFSAYEFKERADNIISSNSKIPIIAGGTGFYISSFLNNAQLGFLSQNKYHQFLNEYNDRSLSSLVEELSNIDFVASEKIDLKNKRRVLRALAVKKLTDRSIIDQTDNESNYDYFLIGLDSERSFIYERINKRVDQMIDLGILDEAREVYKHQDKYPLLSKAIAYKEFFPYFEGKNDLERSVELLKQKTRNYAKRQLTWFRNQLSVNWYNISDPCYIKKIDNDLHKWSKKY